MYLSHPHLSVTAVLVLLALVLTPGFQIAAAPDGTASGGGLGSLLSAPMPGTRARESAEFSATLEQALTGFDGVHAATVLISPAPESAPASCELAIQLTLTDGFAPTTGWLEAIRAFSLRTTPHLDPNSLTIVDSTGRILHDHGETHLPAHLRPAPEIGLIDETFRFEPWWLWVAGGVGFLLVVAGVWAQFFLRREPASAIPQREPKPLDFLDALPDEQLVRMLADERAEVVGAVLSLVSEPLATRLRRHDELTSPLCESMEPPDSGMTAALAQALREKLVQA